MKSDIEKGIDFLWAIIPYVWAVMSIVYMIYDIKFNAFSMTSVVFCWFVERIRSKRKNGNVASE